MGADDYETDDARTRAYVPPAPAIARPVPMRPAAPAPASTSGTRVLAYVVAIGSALIVVLAVLVVGVVLTLRRAPAPAATLAPSPLLPAAAKPPHLEPALPPARPHTVVMDLALNDAIVLRSMGEDERTFEMEARWAAGGPAYAELHRDPSVHMGRRVALEGRVEEIAQAPQGGSIVRISALPRGAGEVWVAWLGPPLPSWVRRGSLARFIGYASGSVILAGDDPPSIVAVGVLR